MNSQPIPVPVMVWKGTNFHEVQAFLRDFEIPVRRLGASHVLIGDTVTGDLVTTLELGDTLLLNGDQLGIARQRDKRNSG